MEYSIKKEGFKRIDFWRISALFVHIVKVEECGYKFIE